MSQPPTTRGQSFYTSGLGDELPLHVQLRNSRPVGELLHALANLGVLEHVYVGVVLATLLLQHLRDGAREAALGHVWAPLHEQHYFVLIDELLQLLLHIVVVGALNLALGREVRMRAEGPGGATGRPCWSQDLAEKQGGWAPRDQHRGRWAPGGHAPRGPRQELAAGHGSHAPWGAGG